MKKHTTTSRQVQHDPAADKPNFRTRQHSLSQQVHDHKLKDQFGLLPSETAILQYLAFRCGMNEARSWTISLKRIVDETGYSLSTVKRATAKLHRLGIVRRSGTGRGRGQIYRYTFPANLAAIPALTPETSEKGSRCPLLVEEEDMPQKGVMVNPLLGKGFTVTPEKGSQRPPVVKEEDQLIDCLDHNQTINQMLSAAEVKLNLEMLTFLGATRTSLVEELARTRDPYLVLARGADYVDRHERGIANNVGFLMDILKKDQDTKYEPKISNAAKETEFHRKFAPKVDSVYEQPVPPSVQEPEQTPSKVHNAETAPSQLEHRPSETAPAPEPPPDETPLRATAGEAEAEDAENGNRQIEAPPSDSQPEPNEAQPPKTYAEKNSAYKKMLDANDILDSCTATDEQKEEAKRTIKALQKRPSAETAPAPEIPTPAENRGWEAAGEAEADAGQVEARPTTSAPIWEPPNDTYKERHQYLKDGRRGKRALRTKETAGNSAPDPHLVDPITKFKLEEMMKSLPEAEQDHIIQELTKEFDVIEDAIKAGEITSAQAKWRRTQALEAQINALNQRNRTGATDTLQEEPAPYLVPEQNQQSDTSLLRRAKDADIAYRKAQIEHSHQRRLRRPQSGRRRFIPAKQVPAITTEKIPFASIAAVWDEPWMAEAVTEFTRRMQPWLDLDTGDEPARVEAAYNPDRPHDTPHIINMKHAYALQQRISVEQRAVAGLTDPLAPLIEAHQARPAGVN